LIGLEYFGILFNTADNFQNTLIIILRIPIQVGHAVCMKPWCCKCIVCVLPPAHQSQLSVIETLRGTFVQHANRLAVVRENKQKKQAAILGELM